MITPDAPDRQYSTRLRTAFVLTGSGTAGAYHAGVLRALHEAGVKIDLAAGRGVGAIGAFFAAVDGGVRLWDTNGTLARTRRDSILSLAFAASNCRMDAGRGGSGICGAADAAGGRGARRARWPAC